jgi:hypothetical protein
VKSRPFQAGRAKSQAALLLALLSCVFPASAFAATPPSIEDVVIGLRGMQNAGRSRNGTWAPVQIALKAGPEDVSAGSYRLVIESADGEAVPYTYTAPVPAIGANDKQTVFAYVRPSSAGSTFNVRLQTTEGQDVQTKERLQRDPSEPKSEVLEPRDTLYLTIGSRLPGLKRAMLEPEKQPPAGGAPAEEEDPQDRGKQRFAFVENVADMPDRWFGYEAVDVVVLTTSSDSFVNQLLEMSKARRDALLDWVRRGGRLILSVGRNQQAVARWLDKVPLFDGTIKSKVTRSSLPNVKFWVGAEAQQKQPLRQVEIACVQPGPDAFGLVSEDSVGGDLQTRPVLVQSSCGLGRVLLVAFDLDAPPFSSWDGQTAFWKKLQAEIAPRTVEAKQPGGFAEAQGELGAELKRTLESFQDVPVISFGWVALFILFYIVLIGPLDYLLLKKVFKRLELTWITFPVLVLIVSVAAYATAYYVKGDDLRINKVDLVEIDLHGPGQVYGTSWFTLFSPRIQNYTVGLEPVAPDWGGRWSAGDAEVPVPPVMLATFDGPEPSLGGTSQSLFRRPYEYAADAGGILRIPVPVWATRTFTSSWRAPLKDQGDPGHPPPIQAELRLSRDGKAISGVITNNLPAELQGTMLFFQGQWYTLGDLVPGESRNVGMLFERGEKRHTLGEWFTDRGVLQPRWSTNPSEQEQLLHLRSSHVLLRSLLFHDTGRPNSGLRLLDQTWRVSPQGESGQRRFRDEVLLIARTPPRTGRAETVTQDGVSPSRLWLDDLPGSRPQRPGLSGYLQQETYVRIYIPLVRSP